MAWEVIPVRNGFVKATVVIDKPQSTIQSTKSTVFAMCVDEDFFSTWNKDSDDYFSTTKDSDCGGYPDNRVEKGTITDNTTTHWSRGCCLCANRRHHYLDARAARSLAL